LVVTSRNPNTLISRLEPKVWLKPELTHRAHDNAG